MWEILKRTKPAREQNLDPAESPKLSELLGRPCFFDKKSEELERSRANKEAQADMKRLMHRKLMDVCSMKLWRNRGAKKTQAQEMELQTFSR
ncbi:hypothetical protein BSKO_08157 [Bryopsis sp. KO-2023]|nr:hypothetical protein BSKO_08157 [Bryopsis sp. KO-2023]